MRLVRKLLPTWISSAACLTPKSHRYLCQLPTPGQPASPIVFPHQPLHAQHDHEGDDAAPDGASQARRNAARFLQEPEHQRMNRGVGKRQGTQAFGP